jgi:hypothetical protein
VNSFDPVSRTLFVTSSLLLFYKLVPRADKWKRLYNTEEISYKAARSEELRVGLMKIQIFWGIKARLGLLDFEDGSVTNNILEDLYFHCTRLFLKLDLYFIIKEECAYRLLLYDCS